MRGGIVVVNQYRFQLGLHKDLSYLFMEISELNFKGSEGSATFGDPQNINDRLDIRTTLSGLFDRPVCEALKDSETGSQNSQGNNF
jgi:hypothetical protein